MADTLSLPFRFGSDGRAATVAQGTDEAVLQSIAVVLMTRLGERALLPWLGIHDPTWGELDLVEANAAITQAGIDVTLRRLSAEWVDATTRRLVLEAERNR